MIAMRAPQPEPHARHIERGRIATRRRLRRAQRRNYAAFVRVGVGAIALLVPVMIYVMLTANITSLNYKIARAQEHKSDLLAATLRQEDQIAKLESRERLAAIAVKLGMRDPQTFAVVALPAVRRVPDTEHGVALLGAVSDWFGAATGDPRE